MKGPVDERVDVRQCTEDGWKGKQTSRPAGSYGRPCTPGSFTATRSTSTPSTAKRFRSMAPYVALVLFPWVGFRPSRGSGRPWTPRVPETTSQVGWVHGGREGTKARHGRDGTPCGACEVPTVVPHRSRPAVCTDRRAGKGAKSGHVAHWLGRGSPVVGAEGRASGGV